MNPRSLPLLRDVIKKFGLSARASLGQNFLLDNNINEKIARAIAPQGKVVMEIGAGPGGLTRALLASKPKKLFAVEIDKRAIPALEELKTFYPSLDIIQEDALKIDLEIDIDIIVGNLPFNVASPLLALWLLAPRPSYKEVIVLVQKEVAERITAVPHTRAFGRLSILCQWRGKAKTLFTIPSSAFAPRPKVDSALVAIQLTPTLEYLAPEAIDYVSRLAFSQKRKMLRAHKILLPSLEALNIDPRLRAEQLSIAQFRALAADVFKRNPLLRG